jgi:hypothetical protein
MIEVIDLPRAVLQRAVSFSRNPPPLGIGRLSGIFRPVNDHQQILRMDWPDLSHPPGNVSTVLPLSLGSPVLCGLAFCLPSPC